MKVIEGGGESKDPKAVYEQENRRKALLAKVHIAKKELGWTDYQYRNFLTVHFGVPTSAALDAGQLDRLVEIFKDSFGWKQKPTPGQANADYQIQALRHRARDLAAKLSGGEERLPGLCSKICGVDRLEWATDEKALKRLLAVLGNYYRKEAGERQGGTEWGR